MIEYGRVTGVKNNIAYVKFIRTSACGKCQACGMLANQNEIVVEVPNELGAEIGQRVAVSIKMRKAIKASIIAYVFPLIMLILGVLLGWLLTNVWQVFENADVTMAITSIIFVLLSFLLLKIGSPLYNKTVKNVYTMVKIAAADEEESC